MVLPTPIKNIVQEINLAKWVIKKLFPELPNNKQNILAIAFVAIVFVFLGMSFLLLNRNSVSRSGQEQNQPPKQEQKQEVNLSLGEKDKNTPEVKAAETDDAYLDFLNSEWDTSRFSLESDGFYCPLQKGTFSYYFILSQKQRDFLDKFGFKIKTRPLSENFIESQGEVVFIQKIDGYNLFEFYFPTRNFLRVKHKYEKSNEEGVKSSVWYEPGKSIYAQVKPYTTIEIEYQHSLLVANNISSVFHVVYIPKDKDDSTSVSGDFSYSFPIVDTPSPEDLRGVIGIGVDRNSCIKIEKVL